jgi:hypothetical protein
MRFDWDRLPNTRDVCFELSEFPEALSIEIHSQLAPIRQSNPTNP